MTALFLLPGFAYPAIGSAAQITAGVGFSHLERVGHLSGPVQDAG